MKNVRRSTSRCARAWIKRQSPARHKFLFVSVGVVPERINVELAPEVDGGSDTDHIQMSVLRRFYINQRVFAYGRRTEVHGVELGVRLVDRAGGGGSNRFSSGLQCSGKHIHWIEELVENRGVVSACSMQDVERVLSHGRGRYRRYLGGKQAKILQRMRCNAWKREYGMQRAYFNINSSHVGTEGN